LVKIGPVGIEIIGLTESSKIKKINKYETKAEHRLVFGSNPGRANQTQIPRQGNLSVV